MNLECRQCWDGKSNNQLVSNNAYFATIAIFGDFIACIKGTFVVASIGFLHAKVLLMFLAAACCRHLLLSQFFHCTSPHRLFIVFAGFLQLAILF